MESERLTGRSWEEFEEWLSNKADNTRKNYLNGLMKFLMKYDLSTEELYEMHHLNLKSDDPRDAHIVPRMVSKVRKQLINSGFKTSTTKHIKDGVNAFMKANALPFEMNGEAPRLDTEGPEMISQEQIRILLDATGSNRLKSIITMMKDSGLRAVDIANLKVQHVITVIRDNSLRFHSFSIRQEKTGFMADPVIGPDAIKYLRLWWPERRKWLDEGAEEPVYCKVENKRGGKAGDPLNLKNGISNLISTLTKKTGLMRFNISGHSLRKFHQTQLQAARVSDSWIDKMTGRKSSGSKRVYAKPSRDQLIAIYESAYSNLSIEGATAQELNEVRDELESTKVELQSSNEGTSTALSAMRILMQQNESERQRLEKELVEERKRIDEIYQAIKIGLRENKVIGIELPNPVEDKIIGVKDAEKDK